MKKLVSALLTVMCLVALFSACENTTVIVEETELVVATMYGGTDANRSAYEKAYHAYEEASGNIVLDRSATSDEIWKAQIVTDFEVGAEPDVLFYFTGTDANSIVRAGKVVPVEEIQREYPDYASNMEQALMPLSPVDERCYAVPVNGYWEALYVNKAVLEACGLEMPEDGYTWDGFINDCKIIRDKGYTPIAVSEYPHYWFEYFLFNESTVDSHTVIPAKDSPERLEAWSAALGQFKEFYDMGFFPDNYLTANDDETCMLMVDDEAAFLLEGSWKINYFIEHGVEDNITVTYVPAYGSRNAADMIGGLSSGYYITRKAWEEDENKRQACVDFVMAMTTDRVVSTFGETSVTALKNGTVDSGDESQLVIDAKALVEGATVMSPAAQDGMSGDARSIMFSAIRRYIVTGAKTPEQILTDIFELM